MIWRACIRSRAGAYDRAMIRVLAIAALCAGWCPPAGAPPRPPAWPEPATAVVRRPAAAPCDPDPENDEDGIGELACARDEAGRRDYADADVRAQILMKNFPYSKVAAAAEELHADILAAEGNYADADAAYARWLDTHRWSDPADIELVHQKQLDAHARAR
jgi:hypothetical protein